jgi:thymidylate kinase
MKQKIKSICIDGMEKTGKTSVIRELRKFYKNENVDLCEMNGTNTSSLEQQEAILQSDGTLVLKENGLLSVFYKELKEFKSIEYLTEMYQDWITKEMHINHKYGAVNFFIIPENEKVIERMFSSEEVPNYYNDLIGFYKKINDTILSAGLNIELVFINEYDRIYDVKDKVLKILREKYSLNID